MLTAVKDFFEEIFYYARNAEKAANRIFYWMVGIGLIVLSVLILVSLVLFIVNTIRFGFALRFLIFFLVAVVLEIVMIVWLKLG